MSDEALLKEALWTIQQLKQKLDCQQAGRVAVNSDIAIIGMACQFPKAQNIQMFWQQLCEQFDGVSHYPDSRLSMLGIDKCDLGYDLASIYGGYLEGIDLFDAELFEISPREARCMDPQHRLLLMNAHQAIVDADIQQQPNFSRTGVFISHYASQYGQQHNSYDANSALYFATGNASSISANRISYYYNFCGPSLHVDTACSSSLVGIDLACRYLRDKSIDYAIVGAVSLNMHPHVTRLLQDASMLAKDGKCKTYDAAADGYVPGEGVGIVVLQRLSDVENNETKVYSIIKASHVNQDGKSNGLTAPNALAQEQVIETAFAKAGIDPGRVQYVETHGTGTYLGDPVEIEALGNVISKERDSSSHCILGCLKTNIGHLEPAAGIAGLIKASLCMLHGKIPANNHLNNLNPLLDMEKYAFVLPEKVLDWPATEKIASISSFGFGGVNGCVVLQNAAYQSNLPHDKPLAENDYPLRNYLLRDYPLYPFQLKSYWLKETAKPTAVERDIAGLKNGTGLDIDGGINAAAEFLAYQIDDSPTELLRVSLVIDKNLPGIMDTGNFHIGFYIEFIYKVFADSFNVTSICINRIDFLCALLVSRQFFTKIKMIIEPANEGRYKVDFYFKYMSDGSSWSHAATASVTTRVDDSVGENESLPAVNLAAGLSGSILSRQQLYQRYQAMGFSCQGFVKAIQSTELYDNASRSILRANFDTDTYRLGAHPGCLDAVLQPGFMLLDKSINMPYMTLFMENINICSRFDASQHYEVYNQLLAVNAAEVDQFELSWAVLSGNGDVCISCKKTTLKKLSSFGSAPAIDAEQMPEISAAALLAEVADLLETEPEDIKTDRKLSELGMDSIMMMKLQVMLDYVGISIPVTDLYDMTVDSLSAVVEKYLTASALNGDNLHDDDLCDDGLHDISNHAKRNGHSGVDLSVPVRPINQAREPYSLDKSRWLSGTDHQQARFRLYCIPYGGGSASLYKHWSRQLAKDIELKVVELPGRIDRITEKPIEDLDELSSALIDIVEHDKPYAIYGHSIGALIAYVWILAMQRQRLPLPQRLFVGGYTAPSVPNPYLATIKRQLQACGVDRIPNYSDLAADNALLDKYFDIFRDHLPAQLKSQDHTLIKLFAVALAADLQLVDGFVFSQQNNLLEMPITALHGERDDRVSVADMEAWQQLTQGEFRFHRLPGDHFFLHQDQCQHELINIINQEIVES